MSAHVIVVAGGAGAMGRITVRDLVETAPGGVDVVVADYNLAAAKKLVASYQGKTRAGGAMSAVRVDITNVASTARVLSKSGAFAVIGAVHHHLNLPLMQACLKAHAHYCDLGGLFHFTRKQLPLHKRFEKAGLLAILGIGAAPGVVNVLARAAADEMDEVHEIHVKVGNVDRTKGRPSSPLGTSYSLATILDEANHPAALFTGGKFTFVEPMSGEEVVEFPAPVGVRRPAYTIHSEVATLPLSFAAKGVREVSFRIAFSDELADRLRFLRALGASSEAPVDVRVAAKAAASAKGAKGAKSAANARGAKSARVKVAPRDVLMALAAKQSAPAFHGVPDEYEVLRVVVRGKKSGRDVGEVIDCHCPGIPAWGFGVDVDTGCPPSIAMQMLARGDISARGVLPPEQSIPFAPFVKELEKRGMHVTRRNEGAAGARVA